MTAKLIDRKSIVAPSELLRVRDAEAWGTKFESTTESKRRASSVSTANAQVYKIHNLPDYNDGPRWYQRPLLREKHKDKIERTKKIPELAET